MIGVGQGLLGNVKGFGEVQAFLHQKADQLRHGHGRVGVIELNGVILEEILEVATRGLIFFHQILQRGTGKEVLLLQAQDLAFPGAVIGIKNPCDVLGVVLLLHSFLVAAVVEIVKVKVFQGLGHKQAQGIDGLAAVADDGGVIGHGINGLVTELNEGPFTFPAQSPGIGHGIPVIAFLNLLAVDDLLPENAVFIANAVADQRIA
ncbi:hypothetical protein SDC9_116784 [bioreactor metagenome]|uniref:Uncharacterized protein n=1 Tax=bioreactor metagenome TaxID=1076179 RepID=A0A645BWD5_9ZZZZ